MKAGDEVLKEIIIRGIRSLEMNRRLGLEKEKLELIIKLHFPKEVEDNKLQSKNNPQKDWADKGGAENMYVKFSKGSSNACICFGFNGDGESTYSATPYAGSALFIDGVGENGNMNSGYGDIKISGKDMTKLLSYLCENDNPVITIKSAQ